jgi:hypothetical protein
VASDATLVKQFLPAARLTQGGIQLGLGNAPKVSDVDWRGVLPVALVVLGFDSPAPSLADEDG